MFACHLAHINNLILLQLIPGKEAGFLGSTADAVLFRLPAISSCTTVDLLLYLFGNAFQIRGTQSVLFRCHAVSIFYLFGDHLAVDAVAYVSSCS